MCCYVGEVKPISPAYTDCPHLVNGEHRCGIYTSPDKPAVCGAFQCAWLRGVGEEEHRPDKIKAMFSLTDTGNGAIGTCVELEPDAIIDSAKDMAVAFVRTWPFPLTVTPPGSDQDDRVVIRADQELKAVLMLGSYLGTLDEGVNLFEAAWLPSR